VTGPTPAPHPADVVTAADSAASPRPPASLARRLAALGYEVLLLSAVLLSAGFLLAPFVSPAPEAAVARPLPIPDPTARVLSFAALFAVGALYFGWSWTAGRRTLPMKTWRIRLTRRDGAVVDRKTALIRYCATWIGPGLALLGYVALKPTGQGRYALLLIALNYLWALADPDRQFLHDRIAGTRIGLDPPPPAAAR